MNTNEDRLDYIRSKLRHGLTLTMSELIYLLDNGRESNAQDNRPDSQEVEDVPDYRGVCIRDCGRDCACD